jgi:hypothetical protein
MGAEQRPARRLRGLRQRAAARAAPSAPGPPAPTWRALKQNGARPAALARGARTLCDVVIQIWVLQRLRVRKGGVEGRARSGGFVLQGCRRKAEGPHAPSLDDAIQGSPGLMPRSKVRSLRCRTPLGQAAAVPASLLQSLGRPPAAGSPRWRASAPRNCAQGRGQAGGRLEDQGIGCPAN